MSNNFDDEPPFGPGVGGFLVDNNLLLRDCPFCGGVGIKHISHGGDPIIICSECSGSCLAHEWNTRPVEGIYKDCCQEDWRAEAIRLAALIIEAEANIKYVDFGYEGQGYTVDDFYANKLEQVAKELKLKYGA